MTIRIIVGIEILLLCFIGWVGCGASFDNNSQPVYSAVGQQGWVEGKKEINESILGCPDGHVVGDVWQESDGMWHTRTDSAFVENRVFTTENAAKNYVSHEVRDSSLCSY